MSSENILSMISNPIRMNILDVLEKETLRASVLSQKLDTSIQSLMSHMDKLESAGLVRKHSGESWEITTVGWLALNQVPFFSFLAKYGDFFKDHDFNFLPEKFVSVLGQLSNSSLVEGTMPTWEKARSTFLEAEEFHYAITSRLPKQAYYDGANKAKQNVLFKNIFGRNTIFPKNNEVIKEQSGWSKMMTEGKIEERFLSYAPFTMAVSEKQAFVIFPEIDDSDSDPKGMLFSSDPDFRNWCLDVFNYYYDQSFS